MNDSALAAVHATRLIPVTTWDRHHPWPALGGLRSLIFNSKSNGFDAVVRRVGRRVLIDEAAFFAWVERQNGSSGRRVPRNRGAERRGDR